MEKTLKMIDKKESKQKKLYNIKNQKVSNLARRTEAEDGEGCIGI